MVDYDNLFIELASVTEAEADRFATWLDENTAPRDPEEQPEILSFGEWLSDKWAKYKAERTTADDPIAMSGTVDEEVLEYYRESHALSLFISVLRH